MQGGVESGGEPLSLAPPAPVFSALTAPGVSGGESWIKSGRRCLFDDVAGAGGVHLDTGTHG
jgi:hypothetical protein